MGEAAVAHDLVVGPEPAEPLLASVKPLEDYCLLLEYETGERRRFDVKPYLEVKLFQRLRNESYFKTVRLEYDGWLVGWPEGEDIAPDDLYHLSVPVR